MSVLHKDNRKKDGYRVSGIGYRVVVIIVMVMMVMVAGYGVSAAGLAVGVGGWDKMVYRFLDRCAQLSIAIT